MWGAGLLVLHRHQDAVNLLEAEAPGTFIVLPEEHPGQFSIMYRAREPLAPGHNVGEVLVPPEALGPQHSLPELLVAQPQLELILQVTAMTQASSTSACSHTDSCIHTVVAASPRSPLLTLPCAATTPVGVPYQFRCAPAHWRCRRSWRRAARQDNSNKPRRPRPRPWRMVAPSCALRTRRILNVCRRRRCIRGGGGCRLDA